MVAGGRGQGPSGAPQRLSASSVNPGLRDNPPSFWAPHLSNVEPKSPSQRGFWALCSPIARQVGKEGAGAGLQEIWGGEGSPRGIGVPRRAGCAPQAHRPDHLSPWMQQLIQEEHLTPGGPVRGRCQADQDDLFSGTETLKSTSA